MKGRRRIRRKELLDKPEEIIGYWPLKEEALDRTLWGSGFRRGNGPVIRQTMKNTSFLCSILCRNGRSKCDTPFSVSFGIIRIGHFSFYKNRNAYRK